MFLNSIVYINKKTVQNKHSNYSFIIFYKSKSHMIRDNEIFCYHFNLSYYSLSFQDLHRPEVQLKLEPSDSLRGTYSLPSLSATLAMHHTHGKASFSHRITRFPNLLHKYLKTDLVLTLYTYTYIYQWRRVKGHQDKQDK